MAVAELAHPGGKAVFVGGSHPGLLDAGDDDPATQTDAERGPGLELPGKELRQPEGGGQAQSQGQHHLALELTELLTAPAEQRPDPQQQGERDDEPAVDVVEEGGADGDAAKPQLLVHQGQQGAEQHGQQARHQQDVVTEQQGLAAPQLVLAVALHLGALEGEQQQGAAYHRQQEAQDEEAAGRV